MSVIKDSLECTKVQADLSCIVKKRVHFVLFFFFFFFCICFCHKTSALFVLLKPCIAMKHALFQPAVGIMVLIAHANRKGSCVPAHLHSLTSAFANI